MKNIINQYKELPTKFFSFIIYFLKPYMGRWFFILCFIAYLGLFVSLEPFSLKLIIDHILKYKATNNISQVGIFILFFIIVRLTHSLSAFGIDTLLAYVHPNIRQDIAAQLLNNLFFHKEAFYQEELSGSLASKISTMQDSVKNILDNSRRIFRFFCEILFACLFTSFIHPIYILVILGWATVFVIFGLLFSSHLNILSYKLSESSNEAFGKIVDVISNIFTVKIFYHYKYENRHISTYLKATANRDKDFRLLQAKSWIILDIFCLLLSLGMIILLIKLMNKAMITPGDFTFIVMITSSLTATVFGILEQFEEFINNIGAGKQSLEVFFKDINFKEIHLHKPLVVQDGTIRFTNVEFQYGQKQFFKNLSVNIVGGEKIGLVGVSGSGKSTFIKLILRLIEPSSGLILIDNMDISKVSQESIMRVISFVNQDPVLFHRSIKENIRYGNPEASDEEVISAARRAYIDDFIKSLPAGYDTSVGEKGVKLSGGQRQRIAMARAFLKSSKILIMDEATSSLDTITEKYIQNSLSELTKNRTSLIIAHRLSTVSKLDRILVFSQGKLVEDGSPGSLLKKKGLYKKLWDHSIDGLLPENLKV
ncbi:ABC transporter ATP-binding protein [Rickettsia tamurae]|uniref:Multidrug export ATP-binding/permease protein n=1 Tax=Rickettsia tamurae subsp. buchneri TaxID=1462938 RepID=A0A8E1C0B4_9RICK|nr:ABC transporter ATP-binding protein [Rickettsia tamurae]KDO03409.1 Putative multidrug export ATP-binding/permease protein [Rickettsia tamurae subsp. buchneri]